MTLATAVRLASTADRGRVALIAGSIAVAGALVLAAVHILRLPAFGFDDLNGRDHHSDLANYLTESGLRAGVVVAALLLTVPVFALTIQALRLGSVARDRRMASLRLAGATPRDVRLIAAVEAGGAALAGGLLAAPVYLLLWVLLGVLPPSGTRMLAAPDALDLVAWVGVLALAAIAGALAGAAIHARVIVEPLGVRRRERPAAPGRANLAGLVTGIVLVLGGLVAIPVVAGGDGGLVFLLVAIVGLLVVGFASGPRLALACARSLERRRPGVESLLALRRLQADPRSAGRAAGVLFVCGVALGVEAHLLADQLITAESGSGILGDSTFYVSGYAMTAGVVLVAAGVALLTLLVGAVDGLLDARRPLATLAALGVDGRMLERVVAQQLAVTAVPAIAIGACVAPAFSLLAAPDAALALGVVVPAVGTALVAVLVVAVAARLAARVLRPVIEGAIDPENLRVA